MSWKLFAYMTAEKSIQKKKKIKQSEGTCMGGWRDTKRHVKESLELNKKKCEATPEGRNGSEKTKVP